LQRDENSDESKEQARGAGVEVVLRCGVGAVRGRGSSACQQAAWACVS